MKKQDFFYELPENLIAKHPLSERSQSKLMILNRTLKTIEHKHFSDMIHQLNTDDLLVFNNSKVIPARLFGQKETGGKVEILIERVLSENQALAMIAASKAPKPLSKILIQNTFTIDIIDRQNEFFTVEFPKEKSIYQWLEEYGEIPLPPYLNRTPLEEDQTRYQTIYAKHLGSVAAPTAGLHFDEKVLTMLKEKGIQITEVTLHVGAGTFLPMRVDSIVEHNMHREWCEISPATCDLINETKAKNKRVIAIGTTATRTLETAALNGTLKPFAGETNIFIYPSFEFKVIDGLITNFHLPESTLLMLVSALAGKEFIFEAYKKAIKENYRFFSYGDAMMIL